MEKLYCNGEGTAYNWLGFKDSDVKLDKYPEDASECNIYESSDNPGTYIIQVNHDSESYFLYAEEGKKNSVRLVDEQAQATTWVIAPNGTKGGDNYFIRIADSDSGTRRYLRGRTKSDGKGKIELVDSINSAVGTNWIQFFSAPLNS